MVKALVLLTLTTATFSAMVEGGIIPGAIGLGGMGYGGLGGMGGAGIGMGAGRLIGGGMMGPGMMGGGMMGGGMMGGGMMGGGMMGGGMMGAPFIHGIGGEVIDKGVYGGGKKILNDGAFEKASGQKGEEFDAGKQGFHNGVIAGKNIKGEHASFNDAAAGKKIADDTKSYFGDQHFGKEGKQGGEFNEKKGHKKGHVIKGFKKSHHKDEAGNTEEYYDEENDEGGKLKFSGESGSFGEKGASNFKGAHENGEFVEGGRKKQAHIDNEHFVDHNNADAGKYGEKKFGGSGAVFGVNNGVGASSSLGHHENSKIFKHLPFY